MNAVNPMTQAEAAPISPGALVDIALSIAASGLPVFPCNMEKKPVNAHGFLDADPAGPAP